MKKLYFLVMVITLFLTTGCENQEETTKNEYIAMKNNLLQGNYDLEELPLEVTIHIDRITEEEINYKVILENPKENMNEIKAMVVHNYYTEDVFPTIGVFNESTKLLSNSDVEEQEAIEITGTIQTTKDISELNLELTIWIQYITDSGEKKDIYYKTT